MLKQAYLIYGRRRRSTSIFILMDLKRSTKILYIVLTIIVQIGSGKKVQAIAVGKDDKEHGFEYLCAVSLFFKYGLSQSIG